jgi:hypothetical protein
MVVRWEKDRNRQLPAQWSHFIEVRLKEHGYEGK